MKEISFVFFLQSAADVVHVAGNVSVILVRVTLGVTDNMRRKLYCATLIYVDRLLAYGTPCVSVEVAEFYCVAKVKRMSSVFIPKIKTDVV
jgi:hypothetical protein